MKVWIGPRKVFIGAREVGDLDSAGTFSTDSDTPMSADEIGAVMDKMGEIPTAGDACTALNYLLQIATQKAAGNKQMLLDVQEADATIRTHITGRTE